MDPRICKFCVVISLLLLMASGCSSGTHAARSKRVTSIDIWEAVEREDLEAIKGYVRDGGDLDVAAKTRGRTPLLHALVLKKKRSYDTLLSLGASPNTECAGGGEIRLPHSAVVHHAAAEADPY